MSGERKKFTITKEAVAAATPTPGRRFLASFDATGLSRGEVAAALRALANAVEAPDRVTAQADALRARLEAVDPTLAVGTRLAPPAPDESYPISLGGGSPLGSGSFVTIAPAPVLRPRATRDDFGLFGGPVTEPPRDERRRQVRANKAQRRAVAAQVRKLIEAAEDVPAGERKWNEDDDCEFFRHDQWHEGIVIDKASKFTYIVEDKHGRRHEVNKHCLRPKGE